MIFDSVEQVLAKLHEARTGLITFNGAGIAGIIGLMQRGRPFPASLRVAGIIFLIGIFCGVAAWIFGGPYGSRESDAEWGLKRMTIAIYAAGISFLLGTTITFFSAS